MRNFLFLLMLFFRGEDKRYARWAGVVLVSLTMLLIYVIFEFTEWNKRFYDALQNKDYSAFITEIWVFCLLALLVVVIGSYSKYLGQRYAVRWRIWLSKHILGIWLKQADRNSIESPDQRIQEDLMLFSNKVETLVLDIIKNVVMIIVFTPILYSLSANLTVFGYHIPGVLLIAVFLYTIFGMLISYYIANPLVKLEYDHQKYEAELRYRLVHSRDGAEYEAGYFDAKFEPIIQNYRRMFSRKYAFNVWHGCYNQSSFFIPFLLTIPGYFAGLFTLGVLMQIKAVFSRLRNAMAYLMDNYVAITELQAVSKRLTEFYVALTDEKREPEQADSPLSIVPVNP